MEHTSPFRNILNEEFVRRTNKNPNFSIRAFARQLDIEPSSLAQILSGKRKLTDKMRIRLGSKLGFGPARMRSTSIRFQDFSKLEDDDFKVISDWYYYAILELTACKGFKGNPQWISKALNLPFAKTLDAIERLKRLKYLEITPEGKWIDCLGDTNNLGNEFRTTAFTEHQRQVVKKALEALDEIPYEDRVQSSMTLTTSKKKLKEAKVKILEFIEELNGFLREGNENEDVYNISVSLYPLSKIESGGKDG